MYSVLISTGGKRPHLLRRCLYALSREMLADASIAGEIVIADDSGNSSSREVLEQYCSEIPWRLVYVDNHKFKEKTGIDHFWNSPALTNNVAYLHSVGELLFLLGDDIIIHEGTLRTLLNELPRASRAWCVSRTYDVPRTALSKLDDEGTNLKEVIPEAFKFLLSNENNVPNYFSLFTREAWDAVGGFDERYMAGIGAEDSDFMRRVMNLPGFKMHRSLALSFHQNHGGVSHFQRPLPEVISEARLAEGVAINRKFYNGGGRQSWPIGQAVSRVIVHQCQC